MGQNTKTGEHAVGYLLALVQAVFYSTMSIFSKLLYASGLSVPQVMIMRFLVTTLLLGAFLLVWRKQKLFTTRPAVFVQSVLFFLSALLYFLAAENLSAGMTTVVFYLYPAITAIISIFVFSERLSLVTVVAIVVAMLGMLCVSGVLVPGAIRLSPLGIAFALAAALTFALYSIFIQKTAGDEGAFTTTFTVSATNLVASLVIFAPAVPSIVTMTAYQWGIAALLSLLNTILPIVLYTIAIKYVGATKAALIGIAEAPSSLLFSYLILGETITALQLVGIVMIIGGIALVTAGPLLTRSKDQGEG